MLLNKEADRTFLHLSTQSVVLTHKKGMNT